MNHYVDPIRTQVKKWGSDVTSTRRRMRSASVRLAMTVLVAASISGCGEEYDEQAICVDPETEIVVDEDECEDSYDDYDGYSSTGGYYWFYMNASDRRPAVGSHYDASSGSYHSASGYSKSSSSYTSRGTTSRGGFGGGSSSSS